MNTFIARVRALIKLYTPWDVPPEIYPLRKKGAIFFLGLAIIYLSLQIGQHLVVQKAYWVADSIDYIFPAKNITIAKLFSWPYAKIWGAAVLYHLTGTSPENIDLLQALISAVAWLSLAWVFSRSIQAPFLKIIGFAVIIGFSLTNQVEIWNHLILSESLSISLMILAMALWLSLIQRWNKAVWIALLLTLVYWINTRETNLYLCLLIAVGIFLLGLIRRNQRFYWSISCIIIFVSLIILRNSEQVTMPRWAFSLTNVILQRILPQPEYVDFFAEHGMPVNSELRALQSQWAYSHEFAVFNNSAFNRFEHWLYTNGEKTYILFLLTHPKYILLSPLQNWVAMMADANFVRDYVPDYQQLLPNLLDSLLFPIQWFGVYSWLCLALIAGGIFIRVWKFTRAFWLVVALMILWVPHIFLVWHADAMEIPRHAIQANIQFRLSMWMFGLLAADALTLRFMDGRGRDMKDIVRPVDRRPDAKESRTQRLFHAYRAYD